MCRIIDEDSSAIELLLVDVGDKIKYKEHEGNVSKIAIMKTNYFENYYYQLECGKTIQISKKEM